MNDNEMYEILNDFAKQHALAVGLEVSVTPGGMSFKTVDFTVGGKYEYSHMLGDMIRGAEQLLMWARREGKVRFVRLSSDCLKKGAKTHKKQGNGQKKGYTRSGMKRVNSSISASKKRHSSPKGYKK
jgi:hypothetical protein